MTRSDERMIQRISADDLERINAETANQSLALGRMIGLAIAALNQVIERVNELTLVAADEPVVISNVAEAKAWRQANPDGVDLATERTPE